ncbi:polysaccharide deacetylase family protein [Streptomyces sp. NPDC002328]|uniref:polysaccharide deacetylase family protein n=1 Tax=Streptomyces sp. NPDC002328 TaxID=3364642 RepID=UPI0036B7E1BB
MQKDQLFTRRRLLVAGFAAVGVAGAAGLFTGGAGDEPVRPTAPVGGAPARRPPAKPSAHRLQPLTGYGPPSTGPRRPPVRSTPLLSVPGRGRTMVLTFDDGPDPRYTPDILDTLAEYEVPAMFFVCGEMAAQHPGLLARMADEGHVVGNHTWSHPLLTRLGRRRIHSEMSRTCDVIEDAYGRRPRWFRAPYGAWNRAAFQLGAELGMEPLAWTLDTLDWAGPGARTIVDRVEDGAASGVVVLSHDAGGDRTASVRALRTYLPRLQDDGYHLSVPRRPHA